MTGRWARWARRLVATLGRGHRDDAVDDEFEAHVAHATDDLIARGVEPHDARRQAAAAFGSRLSARERVDDAARLAWLDAAASDLTAALRTLRASKGFSAAAVVMLGLGLGANVAVYTVASATLFKGYRGVPDNDRLVFLTTGRDCCVSPADVADWQGATTFGEVGAVADQRVALQVDDGRAAETTTASAVLPVTFGVLRVAPALGRDFTADDGVTGAPPVAILSDGYWRTQFGGDRAAIGRRIRVNGAITTVIGVMPPSFAFPQSQSLWIPLDPAPDRQPRDARGLWFAVARLAEGATLDQARREFDVIVARLAAAHPATNARIRPVIQPFRELFFGQSALAIYGALWGAVGLVLLIVCANLANLLLARASRRGREVAVRLALGAPRARLVRQFLFESLLLSAAASAMGWVVATAAVRGYEAVAAPPTQPWAHQLVDYAIDGRVVAYLAALATATAVMSGGWPAWRLSAIDVQSALRDGGRGTIHAAGRRRLTATIVAVQVALAVVLLAGAGVLMRSVVAFYARDIGYDPSRLVVAISQALPPERYPDHAARRAFYDRLLARVRSVRAVEAVGLSDGLLGQSARVQTLETDDVPLAASPSPPTARLNAVGEDYFPALAAGALAGRVLEARDETTGDPVAVVNRRVADALWPRRDPIGQRLRVHDGPAPGPWRRVVGVVANLRGGDLTRADAEPMVYVPLRERPARGAWLVVRTSGPAEALVATLRREIQAADPELPIWLGPYPLTAWIAGNNWRRGVYGGLLSIFAAMALALAAAGVFAVLVGAVAQRRQEIGVRVAIGASRADVVATVVRQGLTPALVGVAVGLAAAAGANRLLAAQLVDVTPADPATLAGAALVLLLAAVLGCVVPARRALRIDPLVALRHD